MMVLHSTQICTTMANFFYLDSIVRHIPGEKEGNT